MHSTCKRMPSGASYINDTLKLGVERDPTLVVEQCISRLCTGIFK